MDMRKILAENVQLRVENARLRAENAIYKSTIDSNLDYICKLHEAQDKLFEKLQQLEAIEKLKKELCYSPSA